MVNVRGRDDIDMDTFLDEVKLRVDQINNLPQAAFEPQVQRWEQRNWFMGLAVHGDLDARTLRKIGDKVRDEIAAQPGGELAVLQGTLNEQVSIEVSEEALRRFGLSLSDVANAVRQTSLNSSGGRIESPVGDVSLTARNLADTAEQFGEIIIRQSTDQGTVRVADVATVVDGFVSDKLQASFNGRATTFVMIPEPDNMDITRYAQGFRDYIERANDPANGILPEGVKIDVLWDDSKTFQARMDLISTSAISGAILVMMVLLLFLLSLIHI